MVNRMSEIVREMTREEAIRKLQKQKAEYLEEWVDFSGVAEAYDMAIEALEQPERKNAKSDIVEVVRCKDCMWWDTSWKPTWAIGEEHWCSSNDTFMWPKDYCSKAERIES